MSVDELLTQQQQQQQYLHHLHQQQQPSTTGNTSSAVGVKTLPVSVRVEYGDYSSFKSTAKRLSLMDECKVG